MAGVPAIGDMRVVRADEPVIELGRGIPPASARFLAIARDIEIPVRQKFRLIRDILPDLKTELTEMARGHAELVGTIIVCLGNLLTDDNVWKMQYSSLIIGELTKKLGGEAVAVGSVDDYLFHTLLQLGKASFNIPQSVTTVVMTFASRPTLIESVASRPWYVQFKEFCAGVLHSFYSQCIGPRVSRGAKTGALLASIGYVVMWSFGEEYSSGLGQVMQAALRNAVSSLFSEGNCDTSNVAFWKRVGEEAFQGSMLGYLLEMADSGMAAESKLSMARFYVTKTVDRHIDNLGSIGDLVQDASVSTIQAYREAQQGVRGGEVDEKTLTRPIDRWVELWSKGSLVEQVTEGNALQQVCGVYKSSSTRTVTVAQKVSRVVGKLQLGRTVAPFGILFGTTMDSSVIEWVIRLGCVGGAVVTGENFVYKLFAEVGCLFIGSSEQHSRTKLKKLRIASGVYQAKEQWFLLSNRVDAKLRPCFDSNMALRQTKQMTSQFMLGMLYWSLTSNSSPMLTAFTAPYVIQTMEEGLGFWDIVKPSAQLDPLDILPIQGMIGCLMQLPSAFVEVTQTDRMIFNLMNVMLMNPEFLRKLKEDPFCKRFTLVIKECIPGYTTNELGNLILTKVNKFTKRLGVKMPFWATTLAKGISSAIKIKAVYDEARQPELRALLGKVKRFLARFVKMAFAFAAMEATSGRTSAMLASRIDTHGDRILEISSFALMFLTVNYTPIPEFPIVGYWCTAFVVTSGSTIVKAVQPSVEEAGRELAQRAVEIYRDVRNRAIDTSFDIALKALDAYEAVEPGVTYITERVSGVMAVGWNLTHRVNQVAAPAIRSLSRLLRPSLRFL